ncbi:YoaK family protein [Paraburkholderia guartelaensis]|uniref:YoaK family protein n=1 Tax=Paraburkholderia guartelaensis TaxID=2546446 RepID=UPI002AB5ED54|nr:YoaK family protein [Paraburkholderia guartelaensis]
MRFEDSMLAAIAGYVDTLSFVALFGLFTAHVTGNFVLIGAEAAGVGQGVFMKLMAFPAFVAGVVISSLLVKSAEPVTPNRAACVLYAIQAALMLAFCLAGVGVSHAMHADSTPVIVCGMIGAAAMGVQNAHGRIVTGPGVPNTVMTGNVTQVVLDTIDILSPQMPTDARALARTRLGKMLPTILAFAVGAILGALAYRHAGFWALLLPCVALLWLALKARGAQRQTAVSGAATDARRSSAGRGRHAHRRRPGD